MEDDEYHYILALSRAFVNLSCKLYDEGDEDCEEEVKDDGSERYWWVS
jgi:hypothetical protein